MEFIGRKISRDGSPEATFIVDIVEAQICPDMEVPEICCCIKARNTMAEYRLETTDGEKFSTAEAEGFLAALTERNSVKLDDFGLVISNIEYGERTVRSVVDPEKLKKRSRLEKINGVITSCLLNDNFIAASGVLDYEGKFKLPAEEAHVDWEKCVTGLQAALEEHFDSEDITKELLQEIAKRANGKFQKSSGLAYFLILKAAIVMMGQAERVEEGLE